MRSRDVARELRGRIKLLEADLQQQTAAAAAAARTATNNGSSGRGAAAGQGKLGGGSGSYRRPAAADRCGRWMARLWVRVPPVRHDVVVELPAMSDTADRQCKRCFV